MEIREMLQEIENDIEQAEKAERIPEDWSSSYVNRSHIETDKPE